MRGWSIGGDWEIEDSEERSGVWDWTGRWGGDREKVGGGWCVERPAWGISLFYAGSGDFKYPRVLKHCKEW